MAPTKSIFALTILLVSVAHNQFLTHAQPQSCSSALANLNVCAPFVMPGASTNPTSQCCAALQSVDHDCMCSTLRIASQIPTQCNLPPLNCAN